MDQETVAQIWLKDYSNCFGFANIHLKQIKTIAEPDRGLA